VKEIDNAEKEGGPQAAISTETRSMTTPTGRGSQLPIEIRKHGHVLQQVWRDQHSAIYHWKGGYEIILIQEVPAREIFGRKIKAHEAYPSDSQWGRLAISRPNSDSLDYLKMRIRHALKAGSFAPYYVEHGASDESVSIRPTRCRSSTISPEKPANQSGTVPETHCH